jgi:hypothetical protein
VECHDVTEEATAMPATFDEVLEAVDTLAPNDQQALVEIVQRRLQEFRRLELLRTVAASEREFAEGKCQPVKVGDLLSELTS